MGTVTGSLQDLHVLVIGGASGIGEAVAVAAAECGAAVTIAGRHQERLDATIEKHPSLAPLVTDASRPEVLAAALSSIDKIDHLVLTVSSSAAGLGVNVSMEKMPLNHARSFFDGKFWAQYQCAKSALARLNAGGSITFTSGVAARRSLPGHTIIAANNAAIEAAARQLAKEVAPIRVNVVSPGLTQTRAYDHMEDQAKSDFFKKVTAGQPISRPGRPDEIAEAYLFAMTSTYLTGTVIDMDGGFLAQ